MKIINGITNFTAPSAPVALTLGFFDGVHVGHQALLASLVGLAHAKGAVPVALTFDSHPFRVVMPDKLPPMIMTVTERIALIEELGVDTVIVQPFDELLSSMSATDFLHDLVLARLHASVIVCGYDTHFGRNREGTHDFLRAHAAHDGFELHETPPRVMDGQTVSSTGIREAIQEGAFSRAADWLGRPWSLWARVTEGCGIGRTMGFPTANLDVGYLVLPREGIYAAHVLLGDKRHKGAMYVGRRPTFMPKAGHLVCEVYIAGFSADIYHEWIRVEPVAFIRPDMQCASADDLRAQIACDVARASSILEQAP